jgi:hypothetical protein
MDADDEAPTRSPAADQTATMPDPPLLPDKALGLESFPELLEWLLGTRYREWAVRTYHPSSSFEPGERPSCALMAKVLLGVGPLPGTTRGMPLESTYADALQQLRTRSARRLPEECLERTLLALHLDDAWRGLLTEKAAEWDSGKAFRHYRKDVVERAIEAFDGGQMASPAAASPPEQSSEFLTLPLGLFVSTEPVEQPSEPPQRRGWWSSLFSRGDSDG